MDVPDRYLWMDLRALVWLGGNLGDRLETLRSAARMLAAGQVPRTRVVAASPVYETRPLGPSSGAFLNAVVELRTRLLPAELLRELLGLEARHGRERRRRWDARTLDLDLLVVQRVGVRGWEMVREDGEAVRVPHPEMRGRDFVLAPLGDLAGDEALVEGRTAGAWLGEIGAGERTVLRRLEEGLLQGVLGLGRG
ncbi:MAG: 2-amino-4-hydroxy-6-hydroxymethyldihydropteridine diphosphokinase [Nannocystaceae bacterium]